MRKGAAGVVAGMAVAFVLGLGGMAAASSAGGQALPHQETPRALPDVTASSPSGLPFRFTITGLPASGDLTVTEAVTGAEPPAETDADAVIGGIKAMQVVQSGFMITSTSSSALLASVEVTFPAVPGTLSGSIMFPPGTSVTLTNVTTGSTVTLSPGPFSIPTGVSSVGQPVPVTG
jgi:hypothetical protein